MKTLALSVLLLATALTLSGCGRKSLPVAPRPVTTPVGQSATPNANNEPASTANFQRASTIATEQSIGSIDSDQTVTPAEVTNNQGATKKSFPLDFLLN